MLRLRRLGAGWIGLLSLLLLGAGCSHRRGNAQITSDVQNRIRTDGRMQLARVQVTAANGVVTLSGYVATGEQRTATVQDAAQADDVRVVIDNLRIVDSNPQKPTLATRKPSASVAWPVPEEAGQPLVTSRVQPDVKPVGPTPAALNRTTLAQTSSVDPAAAAPVPPEAHAIEARPSGPSASPVRASLGPSAEPPGAPVAFEPVTVPYGTEIVVRLTESVSSDLNEKGDTFLASLSSPIRIGDRIVIPAEAAVEGRVIDVQSAGRFSGRSRVAITMTRLAYNGKTYELQSSRYSKQGASRDARSVAAIGGGAGVGAILGAILGGGRGAAIGSVIGAGTGAGAQAASKAAPVRLPAESVLSVRLQAPLNVIPSSRLETVHSAGAGSRQDPFSSDVDRPVLKRRPGSPPAEVDPPSANPNPDNH